MGGKGQCEEGQAGAEARTVVPRLGSLGLPCSGPWGDARMKPVILFVLRCTNDSGLARTGQGAVWLNVDRKGLAPVQERHRPDQVPSWLGLYPG